MMILLLLNPASPEVFTADNDFYDYVVVEGTKDGINWEPMADGYDARADSTWLKTF